MAGRAVEGVGIGVGGLACLLELFPIAGAGASATSVFEELRATLLADGAESISATPALMWDLEMRRGATSFVTCHSASVCLRPISRWAAVHVVRFQPLATCEIKPLFVTGLLTS